MSALLDQPLDEVPVTALDFETTGLEARRGDRVVEVAMVRADPASSAGPATQRVFSTLVDPGVFIPADSQHIHGISDAMVAGAPPFTQVLPRILDLLHGSVLVLHNAPFDLGFLRTEARRIGAPLPALPPVVDTLAVTREYLQLPRCNLTSLAHRVGAPPVRPHRALSDARATLSVFRALVQDLEPGRTTTVRRIHQRLAHRSRGSAVRRRIARLMRTAAQRRWDVEIDYTSVTPGPFVTRRVIRAMRVRGGYVEAWCHLRQEDRVFKLSRVHRAVRAGAPPA